jgi:hypothetical protein
MNRIVSKTLRIHEDPNRVLYELSQKVTLIAEASPEVFLDFLEENVERLKETFS